MSAGDQRRVVVNDASSLGDILAEALFSARAVLEAHDRISEIRDSRDIDSCTSVFDVVVGEISVYQILIDYSGDDTTAVVGRWKIDGLREIGLEAFTSRFAS